MDGGLGHGWGAWTRVGATITAAWTWMGETVTAWHAHTVLHALTAFKHERLGHDAQRQNVQLARDAGNHRRRTRARAAAHP